MTKSEIIIAFCFAMVGLGYLPFFNHTEPVEVGIVWNRITGEVTLQKRDAAGWHITSPWVAVARVDTRPMRVCVTTAGRGFSCKLVQFELSAYKEFVETEGFRYYWWANRISFNLGYNEEYRGMKDLLRGYAYGVKKYSFVSVLRDYEGPQ
jgi:hypothetical protein